MSRSHSYSIGLSAVLSSLVALMISGCSSGKSGSLSLSTSAASPAADADAGPDAGTQPDAGSNPDAGTTPDGGISLCDRLLINRVRLVVRSIDLERGSSDAGSDGGADAGSGDAGDAGADAGVHACECPDGGVLCVKGDDVHIGPFLVDVEGSDLADGIHQVFDMEIPQGTYDEVRFVINTLSRRQAGLDGGLAEMKALHASIAVDGVFEGSFFQFTTAMHVQQKLKGPFEVGDGTKNITLSVDPHGWFVGAGGQVLDPNDPENRGTIKANIRCSVRMSSEEKGDGGRSFRRFFDDDDGDDRCREDDDDDGHDGHGHRHETEWGRGGDHGGDGDGDDEHGHHKAVCGSTPALVCGDAGTPAPDGGTDGGTDGGSDGGADGG